jgi:hypothetical protein
MGSNLVTSQEERDYPIVIKEVTKGRLSARDAGKLFIWKRPPEQEGLRRISELFSTCE